MTFKGKNKWKKKICQKLYFPRQFYTLYEKIFQIWDHYFPLLFPMDSKNLKFLNIWLWEIGAKVPLNRVRNTDTKKSCSVRQNSPKNKLYLCGDFTPFISKSFQMWDDFLPLLYPQGFRISKSFGLPILGSGGKKTLNGTSKLNRETDRQIDL